MSLIYCPECGHEISTAAVACPSCGRPVSAKPAAVPRVVVEKEARTDSIPPWVIAPVIILGVLVLFGLIYLFTASDDNANADLALNVNTRRTESARSPVTTTDTTVPSTSMPVSNDPPPPSYPPTSSQSVQGSQIDVPQTTKGTVVIDAKVSSRTGSPQPVRNTRFYLLDKDVESILSDADLDPIEGQTMAASLALATADQASYSDFYRAAMQALKEHIKYAGSTDTTGKAELGSVEPDSYYLFGVVRTGEGFAMWSSPVSVIAGENAVNLTPQPLTQMPSRTSEE